MTICSYGRSYLSANEVTYGPEEGIDVLRVCVNDDVADVALLDFAQDLTIGVLRCLSDVYFHVLGWW